METIIIVIDEGNQKHPVEFGIPNNKIDVVRMILNERYNICGPVSQEVINILTHKKQEDNDIKC